MSRCIALLVLLVGCASDDTIGPKDDEYDDLAFALAAASRPDQGGEIAALAEAAALVRAGMPAAHGSHAALAYSYDVRGSAVEVAWSGAIAQPNLALELTHAGAWQVGPWVTGDGHTDFQAVITSSDRGESSTVYELAYDATYDVALASGAAWPDAGEIHYTIDAERTSDGDNRDRSRDFKLGATIAFLGAGRAELILDDTRTYALDLSTGVLVRTQ